MGAPDDDKLSTLQAARSNLAALLQSAELADRSLTSFSARLSRGLATAGIAASAVAPLQSQAIAAKALNARINRAVAPALAVLKSFALVKTLERRLLRLSEEENRLMEYVDTVDQLHTAVASVTEGCGPAVQRLQEAVEFLSRTKATDQLRLQRLRETLAVLKSLYEAEVDGLRYEGLLDEALLRLQDEFESLLLKLRHSGIGGDHRGKDEDDDSCHQLGSDIEIESLRRMAGTLTSNDCLDICIDIYVKVRYRRAAKAMMSLNPDYLKTYVPEEIDAMPWEALETSIGLWIHHFELAVRTIFVAEKSLCNGVLGGMMDGAVWPECFAKIADRIMAVFFRFGEGVARSSKDPHKLFKLLDMSEAMDRLHPDILQVFDGELGHDICIRFRELQKLLVHAASKVYWEFGLQIEGDGTTAPADGSVPKVVRYAVNYLKCLAGGWYAAAMGRILQTEQVWKAGFLSQPEPDEGLLRDAVAGVLDALQRNIEGKRGQYRDRAAAHAFAVNGYWYMYMRTRGSELAVLVGEDAIRQRFKAAAEDAAYAYQAQAWGPLVRLLEREEEGEEAGAGALARGKMEAFTKGFEENLRRHRGGGYFISDVDLRKQIRRSVADMIVPAYAGFLEFYSPVISERSFRSPESIRGALAKLFEVSGGGEEGRRSVEGGGDSGRRIGDRGRGPRDEVKSGDGGGRGGGGSRRRSAEGKPTVGEGGGRREGGRRLVEGTSSSSRGGRGGEAGRRSAEGMSGGRGRVGEEGTGEGEEEKPTITRGIQKSNNAGRWRMRKEPIEGKGLE